MTEGIGKKKNVFGERIKKLRNDKNLTQKELSEKIGISSNTIASYERQDKTPSLDNAAKFANYFNVSLDWLAGTDENMDINSSIGIASIIRYLYKIETAHRMYIVSEFNTGIGTVRSTEPPMIRIPDDYLDKFFLDWDKMLDLKNNGTIDKSLYEIWIEKQIQLAEQEDLSRNELPF